MSYEQLKYILSEVDELINAIINQLHHLHTDSDQATRQMLVFLQTLLAMYQELPDTDPALTKRCVQQNRRIELLLHVIQSGNSQPAYRGMGRAAGPIQICDDDLYEAWLDAGLPADDIVLVDCDDMDNSAPFDAPQAVVDRQQTRAVYEMLGRMNQVSAFFTPQEIEKLKENPRRYALAVEMNLIES